MAFSPWKKNKQIMEIQQTPAKSQDQSNIVQQSNFINMNQLNSHLDHQESEYFRSTSRGSVVDDKQANFININRLKLFGLRGSSSNTITHENENNPIAASKVDCTLRLGFPPELFLFQQQQQQKPPGGGGDHHLSTINKHFDPTNVPQQIHQEMKQNYEVMNGRGSTPPYGQHVNNRMGMNNFNQQNCQLPQQIMNNNGIIGNHGMFHGGGGPSSMNLGINNNRVGPSSMNLGINNNRGGPPSMNLGINNNRGGPSSMNLGINNINNNNNFGMFHGGRGGGDPSSVVVALPSPGGSSNIEVDYPMHRIPNPLPPPNNLHNPFPYNNIHPAFPPPAPPVFVGAPRRNEPYHQNHPLPPEPERRCLACDTTRTPLWRNGPKGPKSLCNACGIRYKKEVRRIMGMMGADGGQQGETAHRRTRF